MRATQRSPTTLSRRSMVSKYVLTSGSSTNCQRCSAGCSSGLCEGWNRSRMPFRQADVLRAVPTCLVELDHRALRAAAANRSVVMHTAVEVAKVHDISFPQQQTGAAERSD